jgi:hypothetical protein
LNGGHELIEKRRIESFTVEQAAQFPFRDGEIA